MMQVRRTLHRTALTCAAALMIGLAVIGPGVWQADAKNPVAPAPYEGQQDRPIKSLSPDDVTALREGRGWGFAKPAELSGFPGPLHVLELADKLELTPEQHATIELQFQEMRRTAIKAGERYLAAERALDAAFASPGITATEIERLTAAAGVARANLRAVHLKAHLETTPVLSQHQRDRYAQLRGYTGNAAKKGHGAHGQHKH